MRHLVISVDYEIFGNGLGDVKQHMIDPTERMARLCERHNAPLSVYFEAEEYHAFQANRNEAIRHYGYDPAEEILNQTIDLAKRGHDFQLHLHPEWYQATLGADGWNLDFTHRSVDSLFETEEETTNYIRERQATIETLLQAAGSKQKVSAYRAGAFSAQPSSKLLRALEANNFVLDSSVVHGLHKSESHVKIDYRNCPSDKRYWRVSSDVGTPDSNGTIFEVPIYSKIGRRIQQLTLKRLLAKFSKNVPKQKQKEMVSQLGFGKNPISIFRFLAQRFPIKLDFHNMGAKQMLKWVKSAPAPVEGELDVLVLIGHSKEHIQDRDLDQFLEGVTKDPSLKVSSLSEISALLTQNADKL